MSASTTLAPATTHDLVMDPLRAVEQTAFTFEVLSVLRHDLRNKLAPMRNVIAYVRRKVQGTELWDADPRLAKFLDLMETEITAASALLENPPTMDAVHSRATARSPALAALDLARSAVRHPGRSRIRLHDATDGAAVVEADPHELALAVRALMENALEADAGAVDARAEGDGDRIRIEVRDGGPGLSQAAFSDAIEGRTPQRAGRVGLSLKMAHRVARRYGGELELRPAEAGTRIAIVLPRVAS